jgi:P27 family predicted phage terminase small subunit
MPRNGLATPLSARTPNRGPPKGEGAPKSLCPDGHLPLAGPIPDLTGLDGVFRCRRASTPRLPNFWNTHHTQLSVRTTEGYQKSLARPDAITVGLHRVNVVGASLGAHRMSRRVSEVRRRMRGTNRTDRMRLAPEPRGVPRPPATLLEDERAHWLSLVRILKPRGVLTPGDGPCIALTARAWAEYDRASSAIRTDGVTITTARGSLRAHPAATMADRAWARVLAGLRELGPTPRMRDAVEPALPALTRDELDQFRTAHPRSGSKWDGILR